MCASRMLRRSGVAVGLVAESLGWKADVVYQVGIGLNHEEMDVLMEEWGPNSETYPGSQVKIIGCEPHPEMDFTDNYPGIVHQVALSNYEGTAKLYSKKRHKDGSSLHPHNERGDESYKTIGVPVTTLDTLFPRIEPGRVLLWLDCEGSELAVMQGGSAFLKQVDVVNIELTARPPGVGWCTPVQAHQYLVSQGFWLQWIHTQRIDSGQNDGVYVRPKLFKPEYCCVPHEIIRWEECQIK